MPNENEQPRMEVLEQSELAVSVTNQSTRSELIPSGFHQRNPLTPPSLRCRPTAPRIRHRSISSDCEGRSCRDSRLKINSSRSSTILPSQRNNYSQSRIGLLHDYAKRRRRWSRRPTPHPRAIQEFTPPQIVAKPKCKVRFCSPYFAIPLICITIEIGFMFLCLHLRVKCFLIAVFILYATTTSTVLIILDSLRAYLWQSLKLSTDTETGGLAPISANQNATKNRRSKWAIIFMNILLTTLYCGQVCILMTGFYTTGNETWWIENPENGLSVPISMNSKPCEQKTSCRNSDVNIGFAYLVIHFAWIIFRVIVYWCLNSRRCRKVVKERNTNANVPQPVVLFRKPPRIRTPIRSPCFRRRRSRDSPISMDFHS